VYGTWTATHTESGKEIGVKFFNLSSVNEDGKIVQSSDYFDVNGLAAQIAAQE
jgi:limonene-1,2-epoxide hydrolase